MTVLLASTTRLPKVCFVERAEESCGTEIEYMAIDIAELATLKRRETER